MLRSGSGYVSCRPFQRAAAMWVDATVDEEKRVRVGLFAERLD